MKTIPRRLLTFIACALAVGCVFADAVASNALRWEPLASVCRSNVFDEYNPLPGRVVRFRTPIAIMLNGSNQAAVAAANLERKTGGKVSFRKVTDVPAVGIVVSEGDASNEHGLPGCGNVTNEEGPGTFHDFTTDSDGIFNSVVYVHLGSTACSHEAGDKPFSIAEHELTHAIGLHSHFPGFKGDEGLSEQLAAALRLLYSRRIGADMSRQCEAFIEQASEGARKPST